MDGFNDPYNGAIPCSCGFLTGTHLNNCVSYQVLERRERAKQTSKIEAILEKVTQIHATLREQIVREIGEMQINFPDPKSLSGVKELTGTEVKFKAIAIARGSEG